MAIIKTSAGAQHLSGKFQGVVFAQHRCSYQINNLPAPGTREPSDAQIAARNYFKQCMFAAGKFYTLEWSVLWQIYANAMPRDNRKGDLYYISWLQAFVSVNMPRIRNGLEPLEDPPVYENP